jgi:hypothetical protein
MKTIKIKIECPSCNGTGLYQGMAESKDVAVVCRKCNGTGAYNYEYHYNDFKGRKKRKDIKRVYLSGSRYKLGLGVIDFDGIGKVDMDKEGVSYKEFLDGEIPKPIKQLECPMTHDQSTCTSEFKDVCNDLHGGWLSYIPSCKNFKNRQECWKRFEKEQDDE